MFRRRPLQLPAASRQASERLDCLSEEDLQARSAVLAYVVGEGHHDETILALARQFSPRSHSAAVERAIRDLVGEGLLAIDAGRVVPSESWLTDFLHS
jgi:predicted transcriptional regulator